MIPFRTCTKVRKSCFLPSARVRGAEKQQILLYPYLMRLVEFLSIRFPESMICLGRKFLLAICFMSNSQLFCPISKAGSSTVVREGSTMSEMGSFVKPITPISFPTIFPLPLIAMMAPTAFLSFMAKKLRIAHKTYRQ